MLKTLKRMFTLPKRFNSLSDIARNPLGAVLNAAQWAVPLAAAGSIPGFNLGGVFGKSTLKGFEGLLRPENLGKFFSAETLKSALPLIAAGAGIVSTMEQQKALRAQQQLLEDEARRAQAAANQAAAQQAFLQGMPNQTGTAAANFTTDLATLLASPLSGTAMPLWNAPVDVASAAQRLGLTQEDLRELIRRSRSSIA